MVWHAPTKACFPNEFSSPVRTSIYLWRDVQQACHNLLDSAVCSPCLGTVRCQVSTTNAREVAIESVLHQSFFKEWREFCASIASHSIVLREKGAQSRKICWPLRPCSIIGMCTCLKNDTLSRIHLVRCGWDHCPDCKEGLKPPADEDESVLTLT